MTERPLVGMRVIDAAIGPMAEIARYFAELGADVIRIEAPEGGVDRHEGVTACGVSLDFVAANLGKRAATDDQLERLAQDADLLIVHRGTVDHGALRRANPKLVVLQVADFGVAEGYEGWIGSGPVYHALIGELCRSGIPGREPLMPPGYLALACAAVQGAYAALLAHYNAIKTGQGDELDFSVLDGAAQALDPGFGIAGSATAGVPAYQLPRGRAEARHLYPTIPCKDGFVRLCILAPRQWRGMFEWLGAPKEFADPAFDQIKTRFASPALIPAIARLFADKTRHELEQAGQKFGVPTAAVLDREEAMESEQISARKAFTSIEIAPGLKAPFPDGILEIDGERMGIVGSVPDVPGTQVNWQERPEITLPSSQGERALSGLRVLDFGVIVVGAESGRLLADQGADVIKVENAAFPDGSRQSQVGGLISPTFVAGHRNKRSLGLNVRDPKGKALLLSLIEKTDVLLSNFKGGTLESLGLDYASLKAVNPRIIVTDSSAFGPTGPWAKRMGYGPLVRASAGLTMQWRYPGEVDGFSDAITVYPDHVAARIGVIGVLALLIRRLRTGVGGSVSISQAEVMLSHMAPRIAADALRRAGETVSEPASQSNAYPCFGDDEWCVVTIRDEADRQNALKVTCGLPLADWLASQTPRAAMQELQAASVPAGAMLRVSELPEFDYFRKRRLFREVSHPHLADPYWVETAPIASQRLADPPEVPAPLMGQHSTEIAADVLGLSPDEIARLIEAGVLEQFKFSEAAAS